MPFILTAMAATVQTQHEKLKVMRYAVCSIEQRQGDKEI